MESFLIDEWLAGEVPVEIIDEASIAVIRERVRERGSAVGLGDEATAKLVNVASELGHNQLAHAVRGRIALRAVTRGGTPGLELIAADEGLGIEAPTEALSGVRAPAAKPSLGIGMAAILELSDEVDFDVRVGEGMCVWARKFKEAMPRGRELGIYGRPAPGEVVSGDHAGFVRTEAGLLLGLVDGLGHGPPAREASNLAIATMRAHPGLALASIFDDCHRALLGTRGVVMGLARLRERGDHADIGCVGNVSIHVYGPSTAHRTSGPAFFLGSRGATPRSLLSERELAQRDALLMFTDGLTTRTDLEGDLALLREHPIVIAHQLAQRFGRGDDDTLVLVAR